MTLKFYRTLQSHRERWVDKNKNREPEGCVVVYKTRQVAKDYNQRECIDYDESLLPLAMLKAIYILSFDMLGVQYERLLGDIRNIQIILIHSL